MTDEGAEVLVKWDGFEEEKDLTWELLREKIEECPEIVNYYFRERGLIYVKHENDYKIVKRPKEKKKSPKQVIKKQMTTPQR